MELNWFLIIILVFFAMIFQSFKNNKIDDRFSEVSDYLNRYEPHMTEEELKEYKYLMNTYIQVSTSPKHRSLSHSQRKHAERKLNASIKSLEIFKQKLEKNH
jgi:sulfur relay (sulfurtransferase) DsrC/TusE family protein